MRDPNILGPVEVPVILRNFRMLYTCIGTQMHSYRIIGLCTIVDMCADLSVSLSLSLSLSISEYMCKYVYMYTCIDIYITLVFLVTKRAFTAHFSLRTRRPGPISSGSFRLQRAHIGRAFPAKGLGFTDEWIACSVLL